MNITARICNLVVFVVSFIALLAILGYQQRKDAAYQESARQMQAESAYDALNREAERMTSYERMGK